MPKIVLYNADNGLSCIVDAGKGLRQKAWLDDLSAMLKESVEPSTLAGLGLGRLANFPAVIDGSQMGTKPLGEAYSTPAFSGVELFDVIHNSVQFAIGDGATAAFGAAALTIGDPAQDNYATAGAASGTDAAPQGAVGYPAFITSDTEAYNLAATDGILSVRINGVLFTASVGVGAATSAETVLAAIHAANWPCRAVGVASGADAIDQVRLLALNSGRASTMQAVITAGTAGAVIFATETGALRFGWGNPLNDVRNASQALGAQVPGVKAQRRVLPGSVVASTLIAAATVSMSDNRAGVLASVPAGHVGTIAYPTGVLTMTWGANVDNLAAITVGYKSLVPVDLFRPVRTPATERPGTVLEMAIRLLP
jgi:hypothetical protein